mgnify:FL=1
MLSFHVYLHFKNLILSWLSCLFVILLCCRDCLSEVLCCKFSPNATLYAAGLANGLIKVLVLIINLLIGRCLLRTPWAHVFHMRFTQDMNSRGCWNKFCFWETRKLFVLCFSVEKRNFHWDMQFMTIPNHGVSDQNVTECFRVTFLHQQLTDALHYSVYVCPSGTPSQKKTTVWIIKICCRR